MTLPRFESAAASLRAADIPASIEADVATVFPGRCASRRTRILAVLNLTTDSFHDGGADTGPGDSIARARRFVEEGADGLDLGAESTRPGALEVAPAVQSDRLLPVLEGVRELGVPISIDTRHSAVARATLAAGASVVNDVSGLTFDPELAEVVGEAGAGLIVMHMRGTPADMRRRADYDDVVAESIRALEQAIERAVRGGVEESRILVDPGLGFAKTAAHNREILRRLPEYHALGRPLVVGASRKSFLAETSGESPGEPDTSARLEGTLAISTLAVMGGASVLRVHDVEANRRAIATTERILLERP